MYQTNQPVTDIRFFDRRSEIDRLSLLVDRLRQDNPTWLAIIGQRKVGKTSLVNPKGRSICWQPVALDNLGSR